MRNAVNSINASWDALKFSSLNCAWKSQGKEGVNEFKGFTKFWTLVNRLLTLDLRWVGRASQNLEEADIMKVIDSHDDLSVDDDKNIAHSREIAAFDK